MKNDFTQGRIVPALIRFVFPIMFAMLIQSLYGAVDLLVVGQFSDTANVSAVSRISVSTKKISATVRDDQSLAITLLWY